MFSLFNISNYQSLSDELLMKRIAEGDNKAAEEIYHRYSAPIYRYFYRMLNASAESAEDFTHELFIKIISSANQYKSGNKVSSWLFSIASNMCKNEWRNNNKRKSILKKIESEDSSFSDPGNKHDKNTLQNSLHQLIEKLNPEERNLIVLRFQQELSLKEISEIMDIPEGTVKSRIFYLLKKMNTQLKEFSGFFQN